MNYIDAIYYVSSNIRTAYHDSSGIDDLRDFNGLNNHAHQPAFN